VTVGDLGRLWHHPGNKWEVNSSSMEGILRSVGRSPKGKAAAADWWNMAPSGGLRWPERMRHCGGEVELCRGALERRIRGGGATTVSGVSTASHAVRNSGGGRKNGRRGGGGV
jgi:hypothetical protein